MSISNILVPNKYNLFAESLTVNTLTATNIINPGSKVSFSALFTGNLTIGIPIVYTAEKIGTKIFLYQVGFVIPLAAVGTPGNIIGSQVGAIPVGFRPAQNINIIYLGTSGPGIGTAPATYNLNISTAGQLSLTLIGGNFTAGIQYTFMATNVFYD